MVLDAGLLVALVLLTIAPGADTALVIKHAMRNGLRTALIASVGICSGLFVHALLVGFGVSKLIIQSDVAYTALKFAGAAYLLYLGIKSIRSAMTHTAEPSEHGDSVGQSVAVPPIRAFIEGFFSNVLNPKTLAFYLAFLPQFIDIDKPVVSQAMLIAALHFVIAFIWQAGIAWVSVKSVSASPLNSFARWVEFGCGVCLILIGASIFIPFGSV
jgi:threonine/homoserine/homoserine lactone efflux protein